MKLSEILNQLLDRGFHPQICSNGDIICRINLDFESFGFTLVLGEFIRCIAWSTYAGQSYFDRVFPNLEQAIFAAMMAASLDDARLALDVASIGQK
ncbi:MAG: hypothetical protein J0L70_23115 [Leptolyngbya sp. UWPOB_LEPTO1]|uniref:hypothetical protein n=1 Tax=Leptolyngbya sp. UWPOB_LEPTO1 TaxID=2815653 RepID=UPI001ACB7A07|nr:hypothetical protein [Leptolyngbya sp. UWPOB_LEPTO1]MBN8563431.1 hypothetical protein [Leptolyngbya sp. UWPOB_LEPTO1]